MAAVNPTAQNKIRGSNPDSITHSSGKPVIECDPSLHDSAQNQIRGPNPDSITHLSGKPVIECDPSLHDYTSEEDVQDFIDYTSEEDVPDHTDQQKAAKLQFIDDQFNLRMKELFAQPSSG